MNPSAHAPRPTLRQRRRKRRMLLTWGAALGLVLLFAGAAALAHANFLRIRSVAVAGAQSVAASSLEAAVQEQLAGSYFFLFPKNDIFLYPRAAIAANIAAAFPSVEQASVRADTFTQITLTVVERRPAALWCGQSIATSSPCLLLDARGVAYAAAPHFSSPVYPVYYGALASSAALPAQFLASGQFNSLSALVEALQQKAALPLYGVEVAQNGEVSVDFSGGFSIRFLLSQDAGAVVERFALAQTAAPLADHALSAFDYVDLRFGDRVYYKMR